MGPREEPFPEESVQVALAEIRWAPASDVSCASRPTSKGLGGGAEALSLYVPYLICMTAV